MGGPNKEVSGEGICHYLLKTMVLSCISHVYCYVMFESWATV